MSAEARIALALVSIFMALLMIVDLGFGLAPERNMVLKQARQRAAQGLAQSFTDATRQGLPAQPAIEIAAARESDVLSVTLRKAGGNAEILYQQRRALAGADVVLDDIRIPLLSGTQAWGYLDVGFKPLPSGVMSWLWTPTVRAMLALSLGSSVLVYLFLRHVLHQLDPTRIIPSRVRDAFDVLSEGVLVLDAQARVMMVNDAFTRLDPAPSNMRAGRSVRQFGWLLSAFAADATDLPWLEAMRRGAPTAERELTLAASADAPLREVVVKATPIIDGAGRTRGTLVTFTDVSSLHRVNRELQASMRSLSESREQLKLQNEELHRLATRDPLTGSLNRRAFFDLAQRAICQCRSRGMNASCLMVDIDHFKQFNDRHGHAVGDQVIKTVAEVLAQGLRGTDMVCRYGGEEFCILITELDATAALQLAERLRHDIDTTAAAQIAAIPELRITASFGMSTATVDVERLETLIDRADQALYRSKRAGRNRVTSWNDDAEVTNAM